MGASDQSNADVIGAKRVVDPDAIYEVPQAGRGAMLFGLIGLVYGLAIMLTGLGHTTAVGKPVAPPDLILVFGIVVAVAALGRPVHRRRHP